MDSYILTIPTEFLYRCLNTVCLQLHKLFTSIRLVTIGLVLEISFSIKGVVKSKVSLCELFSLL